ncbi:MAG: hypothetical protein J6I54_01305 [Bacteroidaceae bacterium]|nr:hypothetical protein [Bacteroidaceae bacterium]
MKKEYQKPVSTPYSVSPFLMLAESSGTSIDPTTPGEEDIEVEDAREDNTTGNGGNTIWDNVW